eukprot:sb/3465957/
MLFIIIIISGWTAVERDVLIPWDLEGTSLQIKTSSTLGSDEQIIVRMYYKDDDYIGSVRVRFTSPMQYQIQYCTAYKDLPVQPQKEVDKIWKITKTETALIITCNGVEVLNYLFADSSRSECVTRWAGDVVEDVLFYFEDTASDFYISFECPAFTVEGSTQWNWPTSPSGTTATIECTADHILIGSSTLTCQDDGSWSSGIPQCHKLGEHWLKVEKGTTIYWDLETLGLEVYGRALEDINSIIINTNLGGFQLFFDRATKVKDLELENCGDKDSDQHFGSSTDLIWRFNKTSEEVKVWYNNIVALQYNFVSDAAVIQDTPSPCSSRWSKTVTEILFLEEDNLSNYYRARGKALFGERITLTPC